MDEEKASQHLAPQRRGGTPRTGPSAGIPGYLRYYKRSCRVLPAQVVTPLFLGAASQNAEWRAAPFKALLRKWWRITQGPEISWQQLKEKEGRIFGQAADEACSGKSLVTVTVASADRPVTHPMPNGRKVIHPEMKAKGGSGAVSPLLYLAGMGQMTPSGEVKHSYFDVGAGFDLTIDYPDSSGADFERVLTLIQAFGTIGGRARNAWGSFVFTNFDCGHGEACLEQCTGTWTDGLAHDYPTMLGRDETGPLVWLSEPCAAWHEAMRELAAAYIAVRAGTVGTLTKLDPNRERPLLGIPLTHHPVAGANRHASPLLFKVSRNGAGKHIGLILHLPHLHSQAQAVLRGERKAQIDVWRRVHQKLDAQGSFHRATYKELCS